RLQLGSVLRGVISQRLVPRADGKGRVASVEVLVCNSRVREMIEDKDRTKEITQAISQSYTTYGMQTFDQSLMSLFKQNVITYEEALRQCSNPDDFALRVSGISATSDSSWDNFEGADCDRAGAGAAAGRVWRTRAQVCAGADERAGVHRRPRGGPHSCPRAGRARGCAAPGGSQAGGAGSGGGGGAAGGVRGGRGRRRGRVGGAGTAQAAARPAAGGRAREAAASAG